MSKTKAIERIKSMGYMRASMNAGEIKVTCDGTGETYYTEDGEDAVATARIMQKRFLYAGDGMEV